MNSARTRFRKKILLCFLIIITSLNLTACDLDTIPEWIAGKIIQAIIARDYDLIYNTGYETPEYPEYPEESAEAAEVPENTAETEESTEEPEDTEVSSEASEEEDQDLSAIEDDRRSYYFSVLSSDEQKLYMEIFNAIFTMSEEVELSSADADQVDRIFNLCLMDHPEFFYCDGYKNKLQTAEGKPVSIFFSGSYSMGKEERKETEAKLKEAVDKIIDGVPDDDSDYEKAKYIYEWIIDNTEYNVNAPDSQKITSVLLNHSSVCQGYTMATKYLLDRMGIFCTVVYGSAKDESHAWNLASLDGTYCFIDTTWGDASYSSTEGTQESRTAYNYFGCNSDILLRTHTISERASLPECTSLDEYYYVKESKYFTKVDKERLKALFEHEAEIGEGAFTIRAASEEVYNDLFETLFTKGEIFDLIPNADKVTYIEDKTELTFTFTV